jgi:hypothetical protein
VIGPVALGIVVFLFSGGPMTFSKAVLSIAVGTVSLIIGVLGNKFYYARGLYGGSSGKAAPTWFGRTMFIGVGSVFILIGMRYLLFEQ